MPRCATRRPPPAARTCWSTAPASPSARSRAGILDELEIHLVPVLLGEGRRLFEHLGVEQRELERVRVLEGEDGVVHLRYRVVR